MLAPCFILKITCTARKENSSKIGINAGYVMKLFHTSPFTSKIKLRCIPQPGQSTCVIDLNMQGSWWASSQGMIFRK